jgi:DNA-binding HxlR family transcriptional regulator
MSDRRPVMVLLELLGRRWVLRILWELREPARTFRELQERCGGMSSSVLNERLAELRDARIVTSDRGSGYRLTPEGKGLLDILIPLNAWSERWARGG